MGKIFNNPTNKLNMKLVAGAGGQVGVDTIYTALGKRKTDGAAAAASNDPTSSPLFATNGGSAGALLSGGATSSRSTLLGN